MAIIVGTFSKSPDADESYAVEFASKLDEGDSIADHSVTAPSGLTVVSSDVDGTAVAIVVSGGEAGLSYRVTVGVETANGLDFAGDVLVRVEGVIVGETSYVSLEDADESMAMRGETAWLAADLAARETALIRATEYIDAIYGARFPGVRVDQRSQPLEWPRLRARDARGWLLPSDEYPAEVIAATLRAASLELSNPGVLFPELATSQVEEEVAVGPIRVKYAAGSSTAGRASPILPEIDDILAPLLGGAASRNTRFLTRA